MRLGELLVSAGAIRPEQLDAALKAQAVSGGRLGTQLVAMRILDTETLTKALAKLHGVKPALAKHLTDIDDKVTRLLSRDVADKAKAVPLGMNKQKQLAVAFLDPKNLGAVDHVRFATGFVIEPYVAAELAMYVALERYYLIQRPHGLPMADVHGTGGGDEFIVEATSQADTVGGASAAPQVPSPPGYSQPYAQPNVPVPPGYGQQQSMGGIPGMPQPAVPGMPQPLAPGQSTPRAMAVPQPVANTRAPQAAPEGLSAPSVPGVQMKPPGIELGMDLPPVRVGHREPAPRNEDLLSAPPPGQGAYFQGSAGAGAGSQGGLGHGATGGHGAYQAPPQQQHAPGLGPAGATPAVGQYAYPEGTHPSSPHPANSGVPAAPQAAAPTGPIPMVQTGPIQTAPPHAHAAPVAPVGHAPSQAHAVPPHHAAPVAPVGHAPSQAHAVPPHHAAPVAPMGHAPSQAHTVPPHHAAPVAPMGHAPSQAHAVPPHHAAPVAPMGHEPSQPHAVAPHHAAPIAPTGHAPSQVHAAPVAHGAPPSSPPASAASAAAFGALPGAPPVSRDSIQIDVVDEPPPGESDQAYANRLLDELLPGDTGLKEPAQGSGVDAAAARQDIFGVNPLAESGADGGVAVDGVEIDFETASGEARVPAPHAPQAKDPEALADGTAPGIPGASPELDLGALGAALSPAAPEAPVLAEHSSPIAVAATPETPAAVPTPDAPPAQEADEAEEVFEDEDVSMDVDDEPPVTLSADEVCAALGTAATMDDVGDFLVQYLRSSYDVGLALKVRGDLALGWRGFAPDADDSRIDSILVPLAQDSAFSAAHNQKSVFCAEPPKAAVHKQLGKLLKLSGLPTKVVVCPVAVKGRVVLLAYGHVESRDLPDNAVPDITRVREAAEKAVLALILKERSSKQ